MIMKDKFTKEILADKDAYYMSCPEIVGKHIASQLRQFKNCVELCCAVGMLSIQLTKIMEKVYAIDIDGKRIESAKKNAKMYGAEGKIEFIHGDVLDADLLRKIVAQVAILDPDWSKYAEKSIHVNSIDETQPSLREMFNLAKRHITQNIVIRMPASFTFGTLRDLGFCRIENIIWDNSTKFKVAYFLDSIQRNEESNVYFD